VLDGLQTVIREPCQGLMLAANQPQLLRVI
jgi:hypothetical protein